MGSRQEIIAKESVTSGNPAEFLCWIDAGFGRRLAQGEVPIGGYKLDKVRVNHLNSPMYFRGRKQKINGKLVVASPENWIWLANMFRQASAELLKGGWLIDDEPVLNSILLNHPARFFLL